MQSAEPLLEHRLPLKPWKLSSDYGTAEAHTMMGLIGIKVWIFRGELEPGVWSPPNVKAASERPEQAAARAERQGMRTGRRPKRNG